MNSNELVFDNPRLDEITQFLKRIYKIKVDNPMVYLNKSIVYHELCRCGIQKNEILEDGQLKSNEDLFYMWYKRFAFNSKVKAFVDQEWPYFFQFVKGDLKTENEYIKLYIPLDSSHLYEGANILFDYIASLNIDHCSKISKEIRSDNVIVRLKKDDYYSALKIINFVKSNKYLNKGLNKTNPFVPTISGIGIMKENGISYNAELSKCIIDYINYCTNHKVTNIDAKSFTAWMKGNEYSKDVKSIYLDAVREEKVEYRKSTEMVNLVINSLKSTFNKYGFSQAYSALNFALANGDFCCFTNGRNDEPNYRDLMKQYLDKNTLKTIVYTILEKIYNKNVDYLDLKDASKKLCESLFRNEIVNSIEEACMVTIDKSGEVQCRVALQNYYYHDNPRFFSRYKLNDSTQKNYRDVITSYDKNSLIESIKISLLIRNIDINGLGPNEMFEIYSSELAKMKSEERSNNPRM